MSQVGTEMGCPTSLGRTTNSHAAAAAAPVYEHHRVQLVLRGRRFESTARVMQSQSLTMRYFFELPLDLSCTHGENVQAGWSLCRAAMHCAGTDVDKEKVHVHDIAAYLTQCCGANAHKEDGHVDDCVSTANALFHRHYVHTVGARVRAAMQQALLQHACGCERCVRTDPNSLRASHGQNKDGVGNPFTSDTPCRSPGECTSHGPARTDSHGATDVTRAIHHVDGCDAGKAATPRANGCLDGHASSPCHGCGTQPCATLGVSLDMSTLPPVPQPVRVEFRCPEQQWRVSFARNEQEKMPASEEEEQEDAVPRGGMLEPDCMGALLVFMRRCAAYECGESSRVPTLQLRMREMTMQEQLGLVQLVRALGAQRAIAQPGFPRVSGCASRHGQRCRQAHVS